MSNRKSRPLMQRIAIDLGGFGLILLGLLTGWLPGPGGIPLVLAGLALLSLNYEWAERLLKDFNNKRKEYADKYLMASPAVSLTMDGVSLLLLAGGAYGLIRLDALWQRGLCLGIVLASIIMLLSNQKRFERIAARLKR